ncbi:hypothetical protein F4804DRAFT_276775 [Jackrogersella minutella]|nr:hypothetical protein F4804DRAFT_276775 [Jackrogersella minutella]
MADEVERLAIAPFREIVEKGNTAIGNAPNADEETSSLMLKAAQNLVREGERALKRIEPLCTKNFEEYGVNFVDAIKENDEIAQYRSELEDLLWDFDDYVEPDEFDASKFEELQKASRKAAPKVVDILKRMKLVAPAPTSARSSSRGASVAPDQSSSHYDSIPTSIVIDPPASTSTQKLMEETEMQLRDMMGTVAGPDEGLDADLHSRSISDLDRSNSHRSDEVSDVTSDPPPRPPSTDPWQVGMAPPISPVEHLGEGDRWERRPPVPSDSPTIPQAQPVNPPVSLSSPLRIRRGTDELFNASQREDEDRRMRDASRSPRKNKRWTYSTQSSAQKSHSGFSSANRSPANEGSGWPGQFPDPSSSRSPSDTSSVLGQSIPENSAINSQGPKGSLPPIPNFASRGLASAKSNGSRRPAPRQASTESINSSVLDVIDCLSPTHPAPSSVHSAPVKKNRSSMISVEPLSPGTQPPEYIGRPPEYQRTATNHSTSSGFGTATNNSTSTLTVRPSIVTGQLPPAVDEGLIPVDLDSPDGQLVPSRIPDCSIGPLSSFYKLKGFCKGAEEVMAGRLGFKKIKRPVGGFSMAVVAKCNHCLFEIDFKSVEQDLNNDSSGTFTSNSIGFRLRILQKSHLQIRHVEEQLYGCLFCLQEGKTVEESDATVFFNQSQLFAHMARHPRPLPTIPGITVVEAPEIPPAYKDNFDLHFPYPPMQSVMAGLSRELSRLPSAVATETRKIQNGVMRSPPGRDPVLHFAVGAKIIGIEFPAKYDGKWGIGWHDGVRAAFEIDSVLIDTPPKHETKMQNTSNVQAVARWKWNQKGDDRWLKFDKGDVIKNIAWAYTDHWCWSGTTSKAWGIFPQSHLDPNSIRTVQPGDTASVSSWENKKTRFQISLRKNSDRKLMPFSSVTPTSETTPLPPSRAGVY